MAGIKDYSPVPASNTALFPEGMAPSAVNDGMRQVQADIRTEVASKGADIASAETVDLGAATGDFVDITGTTMIASFGTVSAGIRRTVRFRGALTLTHHATSLILPGRANITTADGDIARFRSLGAGSWVCEGYSRADGSPVAEIATADIADEAVTIGKLSAEARVPAGAIMPFAMSTAPAGWLQCDGSAVSRTTYADLFTAIGTTFGDGDESTTFNLPDLRGEFIRGWADDRSVDTGRTFGSSQLDAFQGHFHTVSGQEEFQRQLGTGGRAFRGTADRTLPLVTEPMTDGTNGTPRTAAETRPRNVALMYCIKY
jgi:microcystin-dependent protein